MKLDTSNNSLLENHIVEILQANCEPNEAIVVIVGILVRIHSASTLDDSMSLADFMSKFKSVLDEAVKLMEGK